MLLQAGRNERLTGGTATGRVGSGIDLLMNLPDRLLSDLKDFILAQKDCEVLK